MKYIMAKILSWAAVRHNICVMAVRYFHRHALGSITCGWTKVPHTAFWIGTLSVHLHR